MTEAGKKWVNDIATKGGVHESFRGHFECNDVEHWLWAFCDELEKRAAAENKRLDGRQNYNDLIASAFDELKKEFLG